jgi:hypothetical protein
MVLKLNMYVHLPHHPRRRALGVVEVTVVIARPKCVLSKGVQWC